MFKYSSIHNGSSVINSYNVYMKSNPKIDFYRTSAVHTILKRYEFNDNEKKIVHAAILTTKRDNPNMVLIEKSDALLKMVTSSRPSIVTEEDIDELALKKGASKLKMADYPQPETKFFKKPVDKSTIALVSVLVWGALVLTANQIMGDHVSLSPKIVKNGAEGYPELYTFTEAQKLCSEKNKVLPLTVNDAEDFLGMPDERNTQGYWSNKGEVIYNLAKGYGDKIEQKHYVVCVDTNGKGIIHF